MHCTGKGIFLTTVGCGDVHVMADEGTPPEVYMKVDGEPTGVAMDSMGRVYIADTALRAVTQVTEEENNVLVKEYEQKSFRGPSSIAFGPDGAMYFTDSGPLGESTLQTPNGSCFCITMTPKGGEQILKPLVLECLAHPCGIAVSADGKNLFVSELLRNRVVRLFEYPSGVWQTSVYFQFSGRVGPSGIACADDGTLYVGMFEPASCSNGTTTGIVQVINPDGSSGRQIMIPGPAVEGIALSVNGSTLYVTEASTKSVYAVSLE